MKQDEEQIWVVDHMLMGNENITLMVDLVVCCALCVTVVVAKIVGCLLPMAAKAVKLDPAVMASPFNHQKFLILLFSFSSPEI